MPPELTLRDLLRIRTQNAMQLSLIQGAIGSALGLKNGEPSILIFVKRKINKRWLSDEQIIPEKLNGPDKLSCPVDVIEWAQERQDRFLAISNSGNADTSERPLFIDYEEITAEPKLSPINRNLKELLCGMYDKIGPGTRITGRKYTGTLGCIVRDKHSGHRGLLTNQHIADSTGSFIAHPEPENSNNKRWIAKAKKEIIKVLPNERFDLDLIEDQTENDPLEFDPSFYTVDAAFAPFTDNIKLDDIDPTVPVIANNKGVETIERKTIGQPFDLDINNINPLGLRVFGVGQRRSFQRGSIYAFCYIDFGTSVYSDYLVQSDEGEWFGDKGDSGKVIFTDEQIPRPVALLWGGEYEKLAHGSGLQKWVRATDINFILKKLELEIVSKL